MSTVINWNKYEQASEEEKIRLLKEGAENGDVLCQFGYGYHLVEIDKEMAMHWFEESAKQGFILASHALGFYSTGLKSLLCLARSAEHGCTASWLTLGYRYEKCSKVQNTFLAYHCYLHSAQLEYDEDRFKKMLGSIYSDDLWDALALDGAYCVSTAQYRLGQLLIHASGVTHDTSTGIEWLKKAMGNGNWDAAYTMGFAYATGTYGIKRDTEKAKRMLEPLKNNADKNQLESLYYALSLCE